MFGSSIPPGYKQEARKVAEDPYNNVALHDLQRKAALVASGPTNHGTNVFLVPNPDFDLNKTIFESVSGRLGIRRLVLKARLGNTLCWKDEKREEIESKYDEFLESNPIVKNPADAAPIFSFMKNECDFACEHADGSFMDHLYFCRDYGASHYKQQSPMVLFLHSIMGVGTNMFPMDASKIEMLEGLLTPHEFKHTAAFPSILRLLYAKELTDEILALNESKRLDKLKAIKVHRVIDNKDMELSADDLWVALNYQMVHQLDFLPSTNWRSELKDPLFQTFVELYEMLTKTNKLVAEMNFNIKSHNEVDEFGMPLTLATMISGVVPAGLKRNESIDTINAYSKAIGHDNTYELVFDESESTASVEPIPASAPDDDASAPAGVFPSPL